jgi:hypothetical protein
MRKGFFHMAAVVVVWFLLFSGCSPAEPAVEQKEPSATSQKHRHHEETPGTAPLKVVLVTEPKRVEAGERFTVQVRLTQAGNAVNDAQDVAFEIWKKGDPKHQKIPARKKGDGVYQAETRLKKPGSYQVMYHVTARGTHVMEAEPLQVQP